MNTKILKFSTLVAYGVMVAVNYLAVALPLAGRDTGAISDSYPNLFAPAGYAFSIWGLIYTLLFIYVIYQFRRNDVLVGQINKVFIVNALFNASWIFAWHYDLIWLSVFIMIGILITLIRIADIVRVKDLTFSERWFIRVPFSVYFGWITVAIIANITVFLVSVGWNRFGLPESLWTIVILLVGVLIGSWRMLYDRFIPYGLVLIWAYGAIFFKHRSTTGFNGQYPSIIWTVLLCLAVFLGIIVSVSIKKKSK